METIECVKCSNCGQLHEKQSDKYVVINGTITSGNDVVIWQNGQDGYQEAVSEQESIYDDGYENGQEDATCFAEDVVIRFVEDLELRDKLLDKLEKGEHEG